MNYFKKISLYKKIFFHPSMVIFFVIFLGFLTVFPGIKGADLYAQDNEGIFFVEKSKNNEKISQTAPVIKKAIFKPGEEIVLRLRVPRLQTGFGKGYIRWNYTYFSEDGIKIWSSEVMTIRKESPLSTWTLLEDIPIVINKTIEPGIYFLEVNIKDYNSRRTRSYRKRFEIISSENPDKETKTE